MKILIKGINFASDAKGQAINYSQCIKNANTVTELE